MTGKAGSLAIGCLEAEGGQRTINVCANSLLSPNSRYNGFNGIRDHRGKNHAFSVFTTFFFSNKRKIS